MASNFYELRLDMVVGDAYLAWADFGLSRVRPNTRKICLKDMPPSTLLFYKGQFGHLIKSRGTAISCFLVLLSTNDIFNLLLIVMVCITNLINELDV